MGAHRSRIDPEIHVDGTMCSYGTMSNMTQVTRHNYGPIPARQMLKKGSVLTDMREPRERFLADRRVGPKKLPFAEVLTVQFNLETDLPQRMAAHEEHEQQPGTTHERSRVGQTARSYYTYTTA